MFPAEMKGQCFPHAILVLTCFSKTTDSQQEQYKLGCHSDILAEVLIKDLVFFFQIIVKIFFATSEIMSKGKNGKSDRPETGKWWFRLKDIYTKTERVKDIYTKTERDINCQRQGDGKCYRCC